MLSWSTKEASFRIFSPSFLISWGNIFPLYKKPPATAKPTAVVAKRPPGEFIGFFDAFLLLKPLKFKVLVLIAFTFIVLSLKFLILFNLKFVNKNFCLVITF